MISPKFWLLTQLLIAGFSSSAAQQEIPQNFTQFDPSDEVETPEQALTAFNVTLPQFNTTVLSGAQNATAEDLASLGITAHASQVATPCIWDTTRGPPLASFYLYRQLNATAWSQNRTEIFLPLHDFPTNDEKALATMRDNTTVTNRLTVTYERNMTLLITSGNANISAPANGTANRPEKKCDSKPGKSACQWLQATYYTYIVAPRSEFICDAQGRSLSQASHFPAINETVKVMCDVEDGPCSLPNGAYQYLGEWISDR